MAHVGFFFFSSRRRHTRLTCDWSSDVCSSDLVAAPSAAYRGEVEDLQTEVLTGFLAAMRGLDPDDLDRAPLASRLCWAAWRAGQALAPCRHGSSPAGLLT